MPTPGSPIRIAVVNDFPVVVAGVATLLQPYRDRVHIETLDDDRPVHGQLEIVLFDPFGSPDFDARVRAITRLTGARVLIYSWLSVPSQLEDAHRAGAVGVVPKSTDGAQLVAAIEAAAVGEPLDASWHDEDGGMLGWPGMDDGLTPRESDVIARIVAGMSNDDIATAMYLSPNSIKTYIRSAYRKIAVTSRTQAVLWGLEHGFDPHRPRS